jgi:hypothetical protein
MTKLKNAERKRDKITKAVWRCVLAEEGGASISLKAAFEKELRSVIEDQGMT